MGQWEEKSKGSTPKRKEAYFGRLGPEVTSGCVYQRGICGSVPGPEWQSVLVDTVYEGGAYEPTC